MDISKTTRSYVNDLLTFKADIVLPQMLQNGLGLAADGDHHPYKILKKLGSLRDSENKVIVKVYEDRNSDYLVFFLFNEVPLQPVIISHPDIYKYYLLQPDSSVMIPKSDGIDPLQDRLNISFPLDRFSTGFDSLTSDPESLLSGEQGVELSYAYSVESKSLEVTLLPSLDGRILDGTKILLLGTSENTQWETMGLFPLRNGRAKFPLRDGITDLLTLCLYR